jgi:hypothetical protein
MPYKDEDDEIECDIIEFYGVFSRAASQGAKSWNKEINLVSWNGRPAKIDIRSWQKDHEKCGKGIALTWEEAEELAKLLREVLRKKPAAQKPQAKARRKKTIPVPETLEPYYDELELLFGAGPEACKSARNTLLKKYHPDRNAANTAFATRKTIKIKEAYELITAWWNKNNK